MKRRHLLRTGAHTSLAAFPLFPFSAHPRASSPARQLSAELQIPGYCGVASGDPTADSVVIWTRIPHSRAAAGNTQGPDDKDTVSIGWWLEVIATSERKEGTELVDLLATDRTVRVRITGLPSGARLRYGFIYQQPGTQETIASEEGLARTLPAADESVESITLCYVSCQMYMAGFYNVYEALSRDNPDFCIHLGDHVYETSTKIDRLMRVRDEAEGEGTTLEQYRSRFKHYLTDPWYREVRRRFTWISLADDHEVANNYDRTVGSERRRAGLQAYFEFTAQFPPEKETLVERGMARTYRLGNLATLIATDQRSFRDPSPCNGKQVVPRCPETESPDRTHLGTAQKDWLKKELSESQTHWNVILSQVMFLPLRVTPPLARELKKFRHLLPESLAAALDRLVGENANSEGLATERFLSLDTWDAYPAEREELLQYLAESGKRNTLFFTGDLHNHYAGALRSEGKTVGYEVVGASITSNGIGDYLGRLTARPLEALLRSANPHLDAVNLRNHMYVRVQLSRDAAVFQPVAVSTTRSSAFKVVEAKPLVFQQDARG